MNTLAKIRAKLLEQENAKSPANYTNDNSPNPIFLHWKMPVGASSVVRFLPDADPNNEFFWVERQIIKIPFSGIKGQSTDREVYVSVPCVDMFNDPSLSCPIISETRPWWKDPSLEDLARIYWKKRSYLFQGFVRQSGLEEDVPTENPIRRFLINPQIYKVIWGFLTDPTASDDSPLPTDYDRGVDFRITKQQPGKWADYSTSAFSRTESPLSAEERAAIDTYGLFDLKDFLPKMPTEEGMQAIKEMFEASVDGQEYDPERWSAFYRPPGVSAPNAGNGSGTQQSISLPPAGGTVQTPPPVVDEAPPAPPTASEEPTPSVPTPPEAPTLTEGSQKADDILAMIRARKSS